MCQSAYHTICSSLLIVVFLLLLFSLFVVIKGCVQWTRHYFYIISAAGSHGCLDKNWEEDVPKNTNSSGKKNNSEYSNISGNIIYNTTNTTSSEISYSSASDVEVEDHINLNQQVSTELLSFEDMEKGEAVRFGKETSSKFHDLEDSTLEDSNSSSSVLVSRHSEHLATCTSIDGSGTSKDTITTEASNFVLKSSLPTGMLSFTDIAEGEAVGFRKDTGFQFHDREDGTLKDSTSSSSVLVSRHKEHLATGNSSESSTTSKEMSSTTEASHFVLKSSLPTGMLSFTDIAKGEAVEYRKETGFQFHDKGDSTLKDSTSSSSMLVSRHKEHLATCTSSDDSATSKDISSTTEVSNLDLKSFLPTGMLSFTDIAKGEAVGFKKETGFQFQGTGLQLFGSQHTDVNKSEEYEPDIEFKPLVSLPDDYEYKSADDGGSVLFEHRCKLYRHDEKLKEWKERGLGNIRIILHSSTQRPRIIMRRDQILKVCCNHYITKDMKLLTKDNDRCWVWQTHSDYSDEAPRKEQFAVKFKSASVAEEFRKVFQDCAKDISKSDSKGRSVEEHSCVIKKDSQQWECSECYGFNDDGADMCLACLAPNPNLDNKASLKPPTDSEEGDTNSSFKAPTNPKEDDTCSSFKAPTDPEEDTDSSLTPQIDPEEDSDVCFLFEELPDPELISMAKELMLPPSFYLFQNKSSCAGCRGCSDNDDLEDGTLKDSNFSNRVLVSEHSGQLDTFASNDGSVMPKETSSTTEVSNFDLKSFLPTGMLSFTDIAKGEAVGFRKETGFQFRGTGLQLFGSQHTDINESEEYEPDIEFKPLVSLPDDYEYKSADDGGSVLFEHRCKLYRHDEKLKEWKERGLGNIRIILHSSTQRPRIIMRRDQILKVCCNHYITKDMKLLTKDNDRCWVWQTHSDYSDEAPRKEQFAVKFKSASVAEEFRKVFQDCAKDISKSDSKGRSVEEHSCVIKKESQQWECSECYGFNDDGADKCAACLAPNPNLYSKASLKPTDSEEDDTNSSFKLPTNPKKDDTNSSFTPPIDSEEDSDVCFLFEELPDPELISKAKALMLPPSFYLFQNKSPCAGCRGCSDNDLEDGTLKDSNSSNRVLVSEHSTFSSNDGSVMPKETPSTTEVSNFDLKSFQPTGMLSFTDIAKGEAVGFKKETGFQFRGTGLQLFGSEHTDVNESEEYEPDIEFKPLVSLPDDYEYKSADDSSSVLFEHRCKLYRHDEKLKEWKERGLGNIRIILHSSTQRPRIIMRRDQILKVCCNHYITKDMKLLTKDNDRCWVWQTHSDYSDEAPRKEQFAVKFKSASVAEEFRKVFQDCSRVISKSDSKSRCAEEHSCVIKKDSQQWECSECYCFNDDGTDKCLACLAPNPNLDNKASLKPPTDPAKHNTGSSLTPQLDSEEDSDVCFLFEELPDPELISKAKALMLPPSFYLFQNKSPCAGCRGCSDYDDLEDGTLKDSNFSNRVLVSEHSGQLDTFSSNDGSVTPKETPSTSEVSNLDLKSFLPTGMLSFTDIAKGEAVGFKKETGFQFRGTGLQLFGSQHADVNESEEYEPDIEFKPLVSLPDDYEYKSADDGGSVLFEHRCKLYRHDEKLKEWKERGLGNIRIILHSSTQRPRIIMRRDQILKVCCNHYITKDMKLLTKDNDRCWVWQTHSDYSDEAPRKEQFAVKFKSASVAEEFRKVFQDCARDISKSDIFCKILEDSKTDSKKPNLKEYSCVVGQNSHQWECSKCYCFNDDSTDKCKACLAPSPNSLL